MCKGSLTKEVSVPAQDTTGQGALSRHHTHQRRGEHRQEPGRSVQTSDKKRPKRQDKSPHPQPALTTSCLIDKDHKTPQLANSHDGSHGSHPPPPPSYPHAASNSGV